MLMVLEKANLKAFVKTDFLNMGTIEEVYA